MQQWQSPPCIRVRRENPLCRAVAAREEGQRAPCVAGHTWCASSSTSARLPHTGDACVLSCRAGEDVDHVAAVLADREGRLQGHGPRAQRCRKRGLAQQAAGRPGAAHGSRAPEGRCQVGGATGEGGHGGVPRGRRGQAGPAGAARASTGTGSLQDQPGPQSTRKVGVCLPGACLRIAARCTHCDPAISRILHDGDVLVLPLT